MPDPIQSSIRVIVEGGNTSKNDYHFKKSFSIGRDEECEIQLNNGVVSRKHLEVSLINGEWWVKDNYSSNGSYIEGRKLEREKLTQDCKIILGKDGPIIYLTIETGIASKTFIQEQGPSVTQYINHYLGERKSEENMGEHTMMIRQAFEVVQKKKSKTYKYIIVIIAILFVLVGAYAIYQFINLGKQKELAENIFYDMKTMELKLSKLSKAIIASGDKKTIETINEIRNNHIEMSNKYDQFIDDLGIYDIDEKTKIIFRMARIFGECELNIPSEFISEVKNYIKKWQSSSRLVNAIKRAKVNGYNEIIVNKMSQYHLPRQFYYLALQESDFKEKKVGPKTRYGYAKGMWQFIPSTASRYGMKVGPLLERPIYDPRDDRFNFIKATDAAARYINDIYATDAQASGLLVMASYNWGEHNVGKLVRELISEMPENPRERNFWRLLETHRRDIPDETYNYVFYIFSAAVICENPRLFGFDFDNPLSDNLIKIN